MKRLALVLSCTLLLPLAACSDDNTPAKDGTPDTSKKDAASGDGQGTDGPKADGPAVDAGNRDGLGRDGPAPDTVGGDGPRGDAAASCVSPLSWGYNGGFVAYNDTSTLTACSAFKLDRSGSVSLSCQTTVAAGDPDLARALAALARADVKAAFNGTDKLFGRDTRPSDGQVFSITASGRNVLVGSPCGATTNCKPIPTGLIELRDALVALTKTERAKTACAALNP